MPFPRLLAIHAVFHRDDCPFAEGGALLFYLLQHIDYVLRGTVIETMHRATTELRASGIEAQALKVGDRAPGFSLFNQDHVQVSSSDLLRQGSLVISFFRGHW